MQAGRTMLGAAAVLGCILVLASGAVAELERRHAGPFIPRKLISMPESSVSIELSSTSINRTGDYITVSWAGIQNPAQGDLLAMYLADRNITDTFPMKYIWPATNSSYLTSGSGSYKFQIFKYYEPIKFYFLRGDFGSKYVAASSETLTYNNPQEPTQLKLAFTEDPSEMRATWMSGLEGAPVIRYGLSKAELNRSATANTTTYTAEDLCGPPASTLGWKTVGIINSGIMTDLKSNTRYYYQVGDEEAGEWSEVYDFISAPTPDDEVKLLALADMGQYNVDQTRNFGYWYSYYESVGDFYAIGTLPYTMLHVAMVVLNQEAEQDGTVLIFPALYEEAATGEYHSAWHSGDVSYARGLSWQWDTFGHQIQPVAARMAYMLNPGNHEYDYPSAYQSRFAAATDSGGECGVPFHKRFPQPTVSNKDLYYSLDHGPIHFLMLNTEAEFQPGSDQHSFAAADLAAVDRSVTPWVVVAFHRMMYTDSYYAGSPTSSQTVATDMRAAFEDMFMTAGVDMTWQGHLHVYQRTCPVYNNTCVDYAEDGTARGPIHVTMGHNGFMLTPFFEPEAPSAFAGQPNFASFGYCRAQVNRTHFTLQAVNAMDFEIVDEFTLTKPHGWELDGEAVEEVIASTTPTPFEEPPPLTGFGGIIKVVLPTLLKEYPAEVVAKFGPSTRIWDVINGPVRAMEGGFVSHTANTLIEFIDMYLNETYVQEVAMLTGLTPLAVMDSYDYIAGAWQGRIRNITRTQREEFFEHPVNGTAGIDV